MWLLLRSFAKLLISTPLKDLSCNSMKIAHPSRKWSRLQRPHPLPPLHKQHQSQRLHPPRCSPKHQCMCPKWHSTVSKSLLLLPV